MATALAKPKFISRRKALGRLYQAAKSPQIDHARAAKNIAPKTAHTQADTKLQKRWWATPTQLDLEGVDTPTSPKIVTKSELKAQEALADQLAEPAKKGKLDANVIESTILMGKHAYLNGEPNTPKSLHYLSDYIHGQGLDFAEEQKINEAFSTGWLQAKDFKKSINQFLGQTYHVSVPFTQDTQAHMMLLSQYMGIEAGQDNQGPDPSTNQVFMGLIKQSELQNVDPIAVEGMLKTYFKSWEITVIQFEPKPGKVTFEEAFGVPEPSTDPSKEPVLTAQPLTPAQTKKIKVSPSPLDSNGKPLIKAFNLKKLEDIAKTGNEAELVALGEELEAKMLSKAKKAAIQNAVHELLAMMSNQPEILESSKESGYSELIEDVSDGDQALPNQNFPTAETMANEEQKFDQGRKNYDKDLEQISGKKGSNEGGLFQDKNLQTFHYVKWPGEDRARVEVLANTLYSYAGVPTPTARLITFQGKPAVMSDWIDGVKPMTFADMAKHPDVRRNFVVDAWLANWDAVGLGADNIVLGPEGQAYRIDPGGSLIYRAQGKLKPFPGDAVSELQTMRSPSTAPQASQVFSKLTQAELKAGAKAVAQVTDQQIDTAVNNLFEADTVKGQSLKTVLKQRRDIIIKDVLNAKPEKKITAKELAKLNGDLSEDTLKLIAKDGNKFTPKATQAFRSERQRTILQAELGEAEGTQFNALLRQAYSGWKGSTTTTGGAFLRWAIARSISKAEGDRELHKMREFWTIAKHGPNHGLPESKWEKPNKEFQELQDKHEERIAKGLPIVRQVNGAVQAVQTGGKDKVTIYRTWRPDQVAIMGWKSAKVGDIIDFQNPSTFSWTFSPGVFAGVGHGGIRVKATVSRKNLHVTDRVNNTFKSYDIEDEVLFKGPEVQMEVIKTA